MGCDRYSSESWDFWTLLGSSIFRSERCLICSEQSRDPCHLSVVRLRTRPYFARRNGRTPLTVSSGISSVSNVCSPQRELYKPFVIPMLFEGPCFSGCDVTQDYADAPVQNIWTCNRRGRPKFWALPPLEILCF